MQPNEFNSKIAKLDNDLFRNLLFFYFPECKFPLRHYSMHFHIFEFHFEYINKYLNHKDIASGCAKLMNNEYNKIKMHKKVLVNLKLFIKIVILGVCQCGVMKQMSI